MLTVAVLGPVEIRRDGALIPVPSGKTTEVLVRLALEAGVFVRADRIIEDLWSDAVNTGRNTLQSKVSQLRRALHEPGVVTSSHGGYALEIDASGVDALRVVGLAASATALRQTGDAAAVLEVTSEALALFRGEVLVDAGEGAWLHAHRIRLDEVRVGLLEEQLAARVELGGGGDVIGELEGLVDRYPLREGLWSSLITALYRSGRQADALAAYTRVRDTLVAELGLEPGKELQALELQILEQSSELDGTARPDRSNAAVTVTGNLPALTAPLVGRGTELTALHELVRDHRLVTMVGPAGVGKTRLAIEVARDVTAPGGVWLVRLDAADASSSIAHAVAEVLHLPGGETMLFDRIATADALLVFDNCEHVVDNVAALTSRLLDASPRLRVFATSQLPLGVDGEVVYTLEPLPIADSIALFANRAGETRRHFVLDDDTADVVEEVCRALDGLPLAIELAAARVKSLSVREIARRLDDRFALLQDPTSRKPERRRALAGAITWSYELLFPDDQRGLWALACFSGGARLDAAEHVLGALGVPEASAVDVVGRLVDRSLVSIDVAEDGSVRYRLLDSIRAFALDRLRETELEVDAFAAHASWFAGAADRSDATVRGVEQPACVTLVRAERANIDAALTWCAERDPILGVRIANGFGWTWVVLGDGVTGASRVRGARASAAEVAPPRAVFESLLLSGWLEASAGDVERAEHELAHARAIADELGADELRADVRRHLAFLFLMQGRFADAREAVDESLAGYPVDGRDWEVAGSRLLGASASMLLGDTPRAVEDANEAVRIVEPIGDAWLLVHAEAMLGAIAQGEHRFDDAAASLLRAALASERLGFLGQAAYHLTTLGRIEQRAGDNVAAVDTLHRAIAAAHTAGDLRMAATARVNLARVLRATGLTDDAIALLQANEAWYRAHGGGDGALLTRALLTVMSGPDEVGNGPDALDRLLDEARHGEDHEVEVLVLDALARAASARGEHDEARDRLAAADALMPAIGHAVDDADRLDAHIARGQITAV